jgi:hypothetical protein
MSTRTDQSSAPTDPPPAETLLRLVMGGMLAQSIAVAATLGIADLLEQGPRTCAVLAEDTGTDAPSLYRLLRALAGLGVLAEDGEGRFALTSLGGPLRSAAPDSVRAMLTLVGLPYHREAWSNLLYSVQTGQPALDHCFGMGAFAYFEANPEVGANFNAAMTDLSRVAERAVAEAYDFAALTPRTPGAAPLVVDVGGGHGGLLAGILKAHSSVRGILFDQPHVVDGAPALLAAAGVADRCRIESGSFFEGVPAGGDAYVLKNIVHDWDDERAAAILRHCRQAIGPAGKLLVVELVVPPPNTAGFAHWADLEMLVMTPGGRERTEPEYAALLAAAGFRLTRTIPTESPFGIVEGVPVA